MLKVKIKVWTWSLNYEKVYNFCTTSSTKQDFQSHLPSSIEQKMNTNKKQIALNSNHKLSPKVMCGTLQKMLKVSQNHSVYTLFNS